MTEIKVRLLYYRAGLKVIIFQKKISKQSQGFFFLVFSFPIFILHFHCQDKTFVVLKAAYLVIFRKTKTSPLNMRGQWT